MYRVRSLFPTALRFCLLSCVLVTAIGCEDTDNGASSSPGGDASGNVTTKQEDLPEPQAAANADTSASDASEAGTQDTPSIKGAGEPKPQPNEQLFAASAAGDTEAVKKALEAGASVHARDGDGNTALMLAAYYGREDAAKLLIERGAEVNAVNPLGRTPLMFAATYNDPRTVKLLLSKGAMVNVRDRDEKFTALMFAAAEGHADIVKLLLEHKADKTLVDVDGDSAADFARQNGHTEVVELLK